MIAMNGRKESISTVLRFIDCINEGNSKKLVTLQTEDFTLIDKEGDTFIGRDGWEDYFTDYPNYEIQVQHVLLSGEGVAIVGKTTGSHVEPEFEEQETVLWVAEVRSGLVASWRIYSNLEYIKN